MNNSVSINSKQVPVVEFNGQRVVTLAMIDLVHERPDGTAGRNFRENRDRFIHGDDYLQVTSDEIRRNNPGAIPDSLRRKDVILLTEQGYLMLVKSLTDDLAWQAQDHLRCFVVCVGDFEVCKKIAYPRGRALIVAGGAV
ncbi:ORF6N domain-containing protein [Pseudomonas nicosulfuronedens]|uniref:ORF6N domain-containing protein n=1 Tax=Pseudomonas nicosulfuronedens TaxID=2571105 RepID=UPI0024492C5E|nr:ORF6N domain-containing protein [Pseudomonas nicosulfuronedens]MDH1012324.1 ORF6N domain-containing protein [Pseudomonas nicosulfuronedens]MDH2030493.1 ORF6N domain-containing protein [Pseudomonas nicosulfuronedens]